jgi:predicted nuclease with TOPRIM domain
MSNIVSLLLKQAQDYKAIADQANAVVQGAVEVANPHVKVASELSNVTGDYEYFSDVLTKVAMYVSELEASNSCLNQRINDLSEEISNLSHQSEQTSSKINHVKSASVTPQQEVLLNSGFTMEEIEAMGNAPQGTLEKVAHSQMSESPASFGHSSGTPAAGSDPILDFLFGNSNN